MTDEAKNVYAGQLYFNGINGVTGEYGLPPMSSARLARLIQGKPTAEDEAELKGRREAQAMTAEQLRAEEENHKFQLELLKDKQARKARSAEFPAKEGVDPKRLDQAGWAVIFPARMDAQLRAGIQAALKPLLDLRREQVGDERLFRVLEGGAGYRPNERLDQFYKRQTPEIKPGPADPAQLPFYVLLIGSPAEMPYEFQYQLDVMRGVGRIDFGADLDAYARYAQSVVMAEKGQVKLARRAAFFGVNTPGDQATRLSSDYLIQPLYQNLQTPAPSNEIRLLFDWRFDLFLGQKKASKEQLGRLLGGDPRQTPAVLLTASHGMEFPLGHERQVDYQGALLCQDWPGPGSSIRRDFYFAGEDLGDANVLGLIAFFFACYGAGTPELDQFAKQAFKARQPIAPYSFVGALPKRLLSQGALAVLGHVERAWGYSFISPNGNVDNQAFVTAFRKLLNGEPVGLATDASFNMRYADMSSSLSATLQELEWTPGYVSDYDLAYMWTASNDARGYVVIGDPAARVPFAQPDEQPTQRPAVLVEPVVAPPIEAAAQAVPSAPAKGAAPSPAEAFGMREQVGDLTASVKQFTAQLADMLAKAAQEIATLEVKTYTTGDMETQAQPRLRALTRIQFDGDVEIYLPEKGGQIDEEIRRLHTDMVREAQANRAQFLATMVEMATHLLEKLV